MTAVYDDGIVKLIHGDVIERLRELDAESVDAIVTDPPYGLEFMGKEWDGADGFRRSLNPADVERDNVFGRTSKTSPEYRHRIPGRGARIQEERAEEMTPTGVGHTSSKGPYLAARVDQYVAGSPYQAWCQAWAEECLRVLKPGGHLLAFGGTRTYHRLSTAIEDAGFEIRDCLVWGYASGFPKSLNVSKAGAGDTWEGWGTALKPAWEPIVMARKPVRGTVAANVLEFGTGGLNIDATRIPLSDFEEFDDREGEATAEQSYTDEGGTNFAAKPGRRIRGPQSDPTKRAGVVGTDLGISNADVEKFQQAQRESTERLATMGRWPANVILTDPIFDGDYPEEVVGGGSSESGFMSPDQERLQSFGKGGYHGGFVKPPSPDGTYGDAGGKSRFFIIPKADRAERERGLAGAPKEVVNITEGHGMGPINTSKKSDGGIRVNNPRANVHPTVKPIDLMRHLVRLVTPPRVTVLECVDCGKDSRHRPNVPQVREDVPAESAPDVLLEHLSSAVAPESSDPLPDMRDAVPSEGGVDWPQAEVLLEGVREQGADGPTGSLRGVRDDVPPQESRQAVLLSDVLGEVERPEVAGVDEEPGGVHPRMESESPERGEIRLRDAASSGDGGSARATANGRRGSRSHQRREGRQPAGESPSADGIEAQQSAEAAAQADRVPELPLDADDLGACASCGGRLAARSRPGVILDPFLGSGTTALAASEEGMRCIGIDQSEDYLRIAEGRLMATPIGMGLSA